MSEEYEIEVIPVVVSEEPIELYKVLKIENLVTSGSEAKNHIANGYVYVNGEVETRKRKKIMFGDIIGFDGEAYQIMSAEELASYDESDYAESDHDEYFAEDDLVDPAALESDSVEAYMAEHDLTEDDFIANDIATSIEADVAEAAFIVPTPVVKPAVTQPVVTQPVVENLAADTWEQPEKKKRKNLQQNKRSQLKWLNLKKRKRKEAVRHLSVFSVCSSLFSFRT